MASRIIGALIVGLAVAGCGRSVVDVAPEPEGVEMSVFRVPSRHGLAPRETDRTLEAVEAVDAPLDAEEAAVVLMPPDVVARPGEEPDEALDRALADGHDERAGR